MTLNGVMAVFCVISANSVAFTARTAQKWLKIYLNFLRQKYSPKLLVLAIYYLCRYSQWITPSDGVKVRNSPVVRWYSGRMTYNLTSLQQIGAWLKRRTNTTRPHPLAAPQPVSCWIFNNGLCFEVLYDVVVKKFTFAILSPAEFLFST